MNDTCIRVRYSETFVIKTCSPSKLIRKYLKQAIVITKIYSFNPIIMKKILLFLILQSMYQYSNAQFPGYSKFFDFNNSGNPKSCSIDALISGENSQHLYFVLNTNYNDAENSSKFVKTDIDGNVEFQLYDSTDNMSTAYKSILRSEDGGFIYWYGSTIEVGPDKPKKLKVIKTDLELNKIWEKLYPLNSNQGEAVSIKKGTDNNVLILYNDNLNNMMRLDSAGAVLNFYTLTSDNSRFSAFANTDEKGLIVTTENSVFSYDSLIAQQWNNVFATPPTVSRFAACLRSSEANETFYAAGQSILMNYSNPNWDIAFFSGRVIKHDNNGNPIWFKNPAIGCVTITDVGPGSDFYKYIGYHSIVNATNNDVIVAGGGSLDPVLWQQYKGVIARLDSSGNEVWNFLYRVPGIKHQALNNIISLTDGSFIASGFADSSAGGPSKTGWLLRIDSAGCYNQACSGMEIPEPCPPLTVNSLKKTDAGISVYPNPASNEINIQFKAAFEEGSWMEVRDILGKTIINAVSLNQKKQYTLNVGKWTNGHYFLRFKIGDQLFYQKIMVLH